MTEQKREPATDARQENETVKQPPAPAPKPPVEPDLAKLKEHRRPRGIIGRVQADLGSRPPALPQAEGKTPSGRDVNALVSPEALQKWEASGAGVRAVAVGDNVITLFGAIGEDYWSEGGGITAAKVTKQLRAIGDRSVEIHLNSMGGDMFEGIAIYNVLRAHSQEVTVKVMGMAASAASIIAMAGDRVEIGVGAFLMIHNCWVLAAGNRHAMREVADYLEPFDEAMAGVYAFRSKGKADQAKFAKLMDEETYLSGEKAIEFGIADGILDADATTVDPAAEKADKRVNLHRTTEISMMQAQGISRSQARAQIKALTRTTDSPLKGNDGTPDAADGLPSPETIDQSTVDALNKLLATMQQR